MAKRTDSMETGKRNERREKRERKEGLPSNEATACKFSSSFSSGCRWYVGPRNFTKAASASLFRPWWV